MNLYEEIPFDQLVEQIKQEQQNSIGYVLRALGIFITTSAIPVKINPAEIISSFDIVSLTHKTPPKAAIKGTESWDTAAIEMLKCLSDVYQSA